VFIWCTFSGFGIMYQEKSGNPGRKGPRWIIFCVLISPWISQGDKKQAKRNCEAWRVLRNWGTDQTFHNVVRGCQIFLGTRYQNSEIFTKLTKNVRHGHKISQMAIKYSKWP
jgi:hypothetical protein